MATASEKTRAATEGELTACAESGATLAELLDHLDQQNRRLGSSGFSEEQDEQLRLYCWALDKRRSSGLLWGQARMWGTLEEDIGG
jgi:hypothetical protein